MFGFLLFVCMLAANCAVSRKIYDNFPSCALLRHHPFPSPERFTQLIQTANTLGIKIDITSNFTLATSMETAEQILRQRAEIQHNAQIDGNESINTAEWYIKILKEMAARAMTEAQYFSTGNYTNVKDFFHYGLSAEFYTHFT